MISLYLFLATQDVASRDLFGFGLGVLVGGMVAAFIATFIFHSKGGETKREERNALAVRRTELVRALPTRLEKLAEVKSAIAKNKIESAAAQGNQTVQALEARRAVANGYPQFAAENLANAETWRIQHAHLNEVVADLEAERDVLEAQTDEEYLTKERRLRGIE